MGNANNSAKQHPLPDSVEPPNPSDPDRESRLEPSENLQEEPWFHEKITRGEAEICLGLCVSGTFLIGPNNRSNGYCLRVQDTDSGHVRHYKIRQLDNLDYFISRRASFKRLADLVKYYSEKAEGLCTTLRYPALLKTFEPSLYIDGISKQSELDRTNILLGQKLGVHKFGEVFVADLKKDSTTMNVNVTLYKKENQQEFFNEVIPLLAEVVRHPNILQVLGVCTKEWPYYIITEYMPNGNMQDFLRGPHGRDIDVLTLVQMGQQVVSALAHLSIESILHRDLRAKNCLVGECHTIKVSGIRVHRNLKSEILNAQTQAESSVKWAAPEALANEHFSEESDIWSFGVLLWELATYGESPYHEIDPTQLYNQLEAGHRLTCTDTFPNIINALIKQCWAWNETGRPKLWKIDEVLKSFIAEAK